MSFLRQKSNAAQIPHYTGLQVQTSSNAVPIQIVYGANKVAPNIMWTGNFRYTTQKAKGGKGGGQTTGYDYTCGFALGLSEGPIKNVGMVWNGQTTTYLWNLSLGLYYGTTPQGLYAYESYFFPGAVLNYPGVAYAVTAYFDLGSSPSLPALSFEVFGRLVGSGSYNGVDANPALAVQDFLTNSQYGVGFPAGSIDATTLLGGGGGSSYQAYCNAASLAFSPVLANQETANSILTRWLQLTNTAAVWSGGKLKFIPYGDASVTGNGVTFTPNVTPIYNLTDDDFVHEDGKDPVEVIRSDPFTAKNWVSLEILDRGNHYNAAPVDVWDQNAIELYGLHRESSIAAHEFCDAKVAQTSAQLILQRRLYIRNSYLFKLSFEYCLLEPMDLVTITDVGLGMSNVAVRIVSIEEDEAGILTVAAEEFPGGTATAVAYPVQRGTSDSLDQGVIPSSVNAPIIFEPPGALTGGVSQVWVALSGGLAPVYKLAEDSSTGLHLATWTSGVSEASGSGVSFTIFAQAAERTRFWALITDGVTDFLAEFDLSTGAVTAGAGVAATTTAVANSFWKLTVSCTMGATAAPKAQFGPETAIGARSYAGTVGDGVYVWGASLAGASEEPTFLSGSPSVSGATVAGAPSIASPEGATGAADRYWGGALVYISTDGSTYEQVGEINGPARQGVLAASVAAPSAQPDIANTMTVNLAESGGALASGSAADAQNAVTLCIVDNELFAYQTATLVSGSTYGLTYLQRGLYGSKAGAHAANAPFARLDDLIFKYALPSAFVGVTLYLKFASFNIFGQSVQDLSTCVAYSYTPTGASTLGPVAQALAVGSNLDYGLASASINETDDLGFASDSFVTIVDMGLASA